MDTSPLFFCQAKSSELHSTAEGIMALVDPALRALYDLKVSVIASLSVCSAHRR